LRADFVELADDILDDLQFVGFARENEAVAAGIGSDEGIGGLGAKPALGLLQVESANGGGQFNRAGGAQIDDARIAHVAARFGRAGAELGQNGFDLFEMLGFAGDNEAAGPSGD